MKSGSFSATGTRPSVIVTIFGLLACQSAPAPRPSPRPVPDVQLQGKVVQLSAAEATAAAGEIRSGVSAEIASDLELTLWASERLLEDPIALTVDDRGQVFVTGSGRSGFLLDIRGHPTWRIPALAMRNVEDMRRFYHTDLAPGRSAQNDFLEDLNSDGVNDWRDLTVQTDRVYRILDTTGDGRADLSQIMFEGFNTEVTDVAGGLLVHNGDLYVAAAPDLWLMRDTTGNGLVDVQQSLSHGYGVHPGFFGHGMSGLTMGPDGRVYWSIGDMGFNVVDKDGKRWEYPNQGAIFRSEPDGSGFEVFAVGLRNTHEFAFDELGNLISVDNDGDHEGETERVVYLVDGSDSGWRVNWQFGKYSDPANNRYNVWMEEGLFRPRFTSQAAYLLPPIAAYHAGPAGMVYNPGTALTEHWRGHFLVSQYTGTPTQSMIHAFQLSPRGAGFELSRDTVLVNGILPTGMEFGPDGALYVADWIQGWDSKGAGRIWRIDAPGAASLPAREETKRLLAEDFAERSPGDLSRFLRHADQRVRLKAQFALATRSATRELLGAARQQDHQLARLHGLWGMGQLARRNAREAAALTPFLRDDDAEMRAQTAKLLGDIRFADAGAALIPLLRDESPRVRFFAAEALGRIAHAPALQPLIDMLAANNDADAYLRHAGSLALARIGQAEAVVALANHTARGVRIAAVVALRRMRHAGVARFLSDGDEYIVTEAARAINDDGGIDAALPQLARLLEETRFANEPLLRRAINANQRIGTAETAQRLADFALRTQAADAMKVEAIAALGVWARPSVVDRVDGMYHGPAERDAAMAQAALTRLIEPLFTRAAPAVKIALAQAVAQLRLASAAPALMTRLDEDPAPQVRSAAVTALAALDSANMERAVRMALADSDQRVRMTGLSLVPSLGLPEAITVELLSSVLGRRSVDEQQTALAALGQIKSERAHRVLATQLERLVSGQLQPEIQLDVVEAVRASDTPALTAGLERYEAAKPAGDPLAQFSESLQGGNADEGRRVAFQNEATQCTRCHTIGDDGATVGPNLTRIGAALTRTQLLEALVAPSARIAPGFGNGPSAMPPMGQLLSRRELRNVVEYLSTLR
jgi:putative membrane-bound dehydrogenase-like protein